MLSKSTGNELCYHASNCNENTNLGVNNRLATLSNNWLVQLASLKAEKMQVKSEKQNLKCNTKLIIGM